MPVGMPLRRLLPCPHGAGKGPGVRSGALRVLSAHGVHKVTRPKALKCPLRTFLPHNPFSDEVGEGAQGAYVLR